MKNISASYPGKVILFGEHAVVYGRPALAVSVADVRARATLEPAVPGSGFQIDAPDIAHKYRLGDAPADDPLAQAVQLTLDYLEQTSVPDARLVITSTIPLGRGLGSGAAISAAVVQAVAQFFEQPLPPAGVSDLVYQVEKLYHGTPSGIDNTVIAYEQPVYFIKQRPIQRMRVRQPFTLVIGDTGIVASTKEVVGDLRRRRQVDRQRYEGYFDEIGVIVRQARVIIEQEWPLFNAPALGKLMNENQEILAKLGVSSLELEQLIEAARRAGAWGAKLSGAGWGGNMIALVPPQEENINAVTRALLAAGAKGVIVTHVA